MIIKLLEGCDRELYDKHARKHGTIFNSLAWINIFNHKARAYGIYDKGNNLIGGFSIYVEKKYGLSVYRDTPFSQSSGPFLNLNAQNPVILMTHWKNAAAAMADFFDDLSYAVISWSFNIGISDMQPFIWKKFKVVPSYTYLLDLANSEKDLLMRMSNERRKNINKGTKDGLIVKQTMDYESIRTLVMKTFSRQNEKLNLDHLNKILFEFAKSNNSFAYTTYNNDNPLACSFCLYDDYKAYYLLGGYDHELKHHGAGTMAMWAAIKHAKALGLKYFDFEGSKISHIERYFRGFGGQLTPYYQIIKAKLPLEIILKLKRRELF